MMTRMRWANGIASAVAVGGPEFCSGDGGWRAGNGGGGAAAAVGVPRAAIFCIASSRWPRSPRP